MAGVLIVEIHLAFFNRALFTDLLVLVVVVPFDADFTLQGLRVGIAQGVFLAIADLRQTLLGVGSKGEVGCTLSASLIAFV